MRERSAVVRVKDGLHARPATQFVKLAKTFASDIQIRRGDATASAKSAVKLMLLGVKETDEVVLTAEGNDAEGALNALVAFLEMPRTEMEQANAASNASVVLASPIATGSGIPASEGVAIGPAFGYFPEALVSPNRKLAADDLHDELDVFRRALDRTTTSLIERKLTLGLSPEDAQIIEALTDVARDPELSVAIQTEIRSGNDAVTSTIEAGQRLARSFEAVDDDYMRARAEDVRSVVRALALTLLGRSDVDLSRMPPGVVLVAEEVSALHFAGAPLASLAGLVCTKSAAMSHLAIMARTHGIPAVLGLRVYIATLKSAKTVALDGQTGEVFLDPPALVQADLRGRMAREERDRDALDRFRSIHPRTRNGLAIGVAANLGSLAEIHRALEAGAMGVGLFRTELLFMERKTLPTEEEQADIYMELARAFAPYPVVVRTLDIGGDKPLAGIECPHEDNPFLGWRGIRMCLDRHDIFKPQLKALLRAATVGNVKIMLPMITQVDEIIRVKALLAECRTELASSGTAMGQPDLGIMMETPAAAFLADDLAKHAAFFSIGTNDLTQYVMAADRLNPRVADLNRVEHPAVLRAMTLICDAARAAGIRVGLCGEAAARPDLIPSFIRMGITELSMSPASIPRAKKAVTETTP